MSQFKSFDFSKRKLQKLWEQNEETTHIIDNDIKKLDTTYLSTHTFKRPQTFLLLDNINFINIGHQYVSQINGFPDWAISCSHLSVQIATWDTKTSNVAPIDISTAKFNIEDEFAAGTLEINDITIDNIQYNYFWTKMENSYLFTFQPYFIISKVIEVETNSYNTETLPCFITVKLTILNEKNYNAIQSGK